MTGSTKYSRELTDYPTIEGETKPRVNPHIKDGKLVESLEGCESLLDSYDNGSKVAGVDSPVLGYRPVIDKSGQVGPFKFLTFAEFKSRFTNFGSGLVSLGLSPGDRCGLYSPNRIEWVLAEMACYHNNIITVPIYDTLGQKAIIHVINEAELGAIVCTDAKAQFLLGIYDQLDSLKNIIVMDALGDETRKLAEAAGVRVLGVKDVEELGEREPHESDHRPNRDEIATICYTSGTTGLPKGVMLTHGNFLSACASLNYLIEHREVQPITRNDVYLSYLPLAHILERFVVHMLINRGARIAFYRGDTLKLMDDVQDLSPTVFVGVPRIFNRIHDKVNATVREKGGLSAKLFHYALDSKKHYLRHGQTNHWFWDRVVFKSLRDKLGGRVSLIVSGSAPISNDALDFLRCSFSANVLEGYGQTETTGACALTGLADTEAGTVGSPFPSCMIKLVDVPDLGYTVKDKPYPRGEICVKGNNVFKGYYKQPEKTLETLDKDGWCHTGDIGLIDDLGRIKIIDRKKNLFKLAQGEYIAPERIENIYMDHPLVTQAFVYGDSLQSMLVAVISPDEGELRQFVLDRELYASPDDTPAFDTLCKEKKVREEVVKLLDEWGRSRDLKGFENIKNVLLEPHPFDPSLVSPTFKLKRPEAKAYYKARFDELYSELLNPAK